MSEQSNNDAAIEEIGTRLKHRITDYNTHSEERMKIIFEIGEYISEAKEKFSKDGNYQEWIKKTTNRSIMWCWEHKYLYENRDKYEAAKEWAVNNGNFSDEYLSVRGAKRLLKLHRRFLDQGSPSITKKPKKIKADIEAKLAEAEAELAKANGKLSKLLEFAGSLFDKITSGKAISIATAIESGPEGERGSAEIRLHHIASQNGIEPELLLECIRSVKAALSRGTRTAPRATDGQNHASM
ncbi:MAG TPA: hypothetical protein VHL98_14590 [Microvirga sp.]|jgi:hypothetical protein|nr:hypothetical protein [Microvirga sp.]